jgi:RNA polymerase sigma-70 factor (ECF subfamily)
VAAATEIRISDQQLLANMAAGEQEALRSLSSRYGNALSAVAERILRDKADAEEVAADVLWQAWREASRFEPGRGSVAAWMMMLVRSRAIDRLRARKAREPGNLNPADAPVANDPAAEIHSIDRRQQVEIALAKLGEGEREMLRLAYFSDLSQSEIAGRTGLPLGTVKSRMRSGLIKLKDALAGRVE